MAVVNNPIIGRASGKVGGVVFSQWKGRNILKQKPTVVAYPRTSQQQANSARFVTLLALGRVLAPAARIGFKEYAGQMSWLNRFMSTNSKNDSLVWNTSTWQLAPPNLVISEGSLYPTPLVFNEIDGNNVVIDFDPVPAHNQTAADTLYLVGMKEGETVFSTSVLRSEGTVTVSFTSLVNGDEVAIYGFFLRSDGSIVSNSYSVVQTVGP